MEEWKEIEGYEGLYEVSNLGRVRSIDRVLMQPNKWGFISSNYYKGKILSPKITKCGYCSINLSKDNKAKMVTVHRLVAKAFIPNPDNLPYVNHKDEVKSNNQAENLEWCTPKYNINYGTGVMRTRMKNMKPVIQYDLSGNLIERFESVSAASIKTGIPQGWISLVAGYAKNKKGKKYDSARGFRFSYAY